MAEQQDEAQKLNDEFARIFDAYRARIDEITRQTQRNLVPDTVAPVSAPAGAPEKPEENASQIPSESENQPEIPPAPVAAELPLVKESDKIIHDARRKAQQIIREAEESTKKEARKKTQSQVEKIIAKAQQEAEEIINRAAQAVEKERNDAVTMLKQQSEQVLKEITEKCRIEAQARSAQIISESREKAAKMMTDVIASSTEIGRQVIEIASRARKTVSEFEVKLQAETGTLAKAITDTQHRLLQITRVAREAGPAPESPEKNKESPQNPTLAVRLLGDKSSFKHDNNGLFCGQVEVKSVSSSFDYQYLKNLKRYLVNIPSIKCLQESASEREISLLFDIKEPLPLLDILNNIPLVNEVITKDDEDICLIFRSPV
jgi:vacuolar-type H+-ATPase subunit H